MRIALCGCMMQEPHVVEKLRTSYRFVDIVFGTHNIHELQDLISIDVKSALLFLDEITGEVITDDILKNIFVLVDFLMLLMCLI